MRLTELQQWYQSAPGRWLLQLEQDQVERWITRVDAATVVQIGGLPDTFHIAQHASSSYFYLAPHLEDALRPGVDLLAHEGELPFLRNSVDLFIIVHTLEFIEHPTSLLKEAFDALGPSGKLLLFCFNPWSYWGLHKLFADKNSIHGGGKYVTPTTLAHWTAKIGYSNVTDKTLCFRAPFVKRPLSRASFIIETLGQLAFPALGAINAFLLEKRVLGSVKQAQVPWKKKAVVNSSVIEPTTRQGEFK